MHVHRLGNTCRLFVELHQKPAPRHPRPTPHNACVPPFCCPHETSNKAPRSAHVPAPRCLPTHVLYIYIYREYIYIYRYLYIYIYEHKDDNRRGQRAHMPFYYRNLPASRGPCAAALYMTCALVLRALPASQRPCEAAWEKKHVTACVLQSTTELRAHSQPQQNKCRCINTSAGKLSWQAALHLPAGSGPSGPTQSSDLQLRVRRMTRAPAWHAYMGMSNLGLKQLLPQPPPPPFPCRAPPAMPARNALACTILKDMTHDKTRASSGPSAAATCEQQRPKPHAIHIAM